jgi:hypothetical protein
MSPNPKPAQPAPAGSNTVRPENAQFWKERINKEETTRMVWNQKISTLPPSAVVNRDEFPTGSNLYRDTFLDPRKRKDNVVMKYVITCSVKSQ